jgi:hypothetical protein
MNDYETISDVGLRKEIARRKLGYTEFTRVSGILFADAGKKVMEVPRYLDMNAAIELYAELPDAELWPPDENDPDIWFVYADASTIEAKNREPGRAIAEAWLVWKDECNKGSE